MACHARHTRHRRLVPGRGARVRAPGRRRLLGRLVRPLPRHEPDPRGARRRSRRPARREDRRGRQPRGRRPLRRPGDADLHGLPRRRSRRAARRLAPEAAPVPTSRPSSRPSSRSSCSRSSRPAGASPAAGASRYAPQARLRIQPRDRHLRPRRVQPRDRHHARAEPGGGQEPRRHRVADLERRHRAEPAAWRTPPSPSRAARSRARPGSAASCAAPPPAPRRRAPRRARAISRSGSSRSGLASSPPASRRVGEREQRQIRGAAPHRLHHLAREPCRSAIRIPGCSSWKAASSAGSRSASPGGGRQPHVPRVTPACSSIAARARPTSPRIASARTAAPGRRTSPPRRSWGAEQLQPELALQPPDLLAQRGLRHVQLLRRAREVPVPRDRREVLELPQVHACGR